MKKEGGEGGTLHPNARSPSTDRVGRSPPCSEQRLLARGDGDGKACVVFLQTGTDSDAFSWWMRRETAPHKNKSKHPGAAGAPASLRCLQTGSSDCQLRDLRLLIARSRRTRQGKKYNDKNKKWLICAWKNPQKSISWVCFLPFSSHPMESNNGSQVGRRCRCAQNKSPRKKALLCADLNLLTSLRGREELVESSAQTGQSEGKYIYMYWIFVSESTITSRGTCDGSCAGACKLQVMERL